MKQRYTLCLSIFTLIQSIGPTAHAAEKLLIRFAQISDTQIIDEESPARATRLERYFDKSWRPQEAFTTQALNGTLRVLNKIHSGGLNGRSALPIDFLIQTGDATELAGLNELKWFVATMDGRRVDPDTGEKDGKRDDFPDELNPNLPFQAVGLNSHIPWYTVFGNHDGLATGVFPISLDPGRTNLIAELPALIADLIGMHDIDEDRNFFQPGWSQSPAVIRGNKDYFDPKTFKLDRKLLKAGPISTDMDRVFTTRREFIFQHLAPQSTTLPSGHGFSDENLKAGRVTYSVRPKPDVPVRLIVLDTIVENSTPAKPAHTGYMSRAQFEQFLKPEVLNARKAGELVIIASHHPSKDFDGYTIFPHDVSTREFRNFLSSQDNIIAHICGHTHHHHFEVISGLYPYPEVETGSVIDYPGEGRILEVFRDEETGKVRLESRVFSYLDDDHVLPIERELRKRVEADFKIQSALEEQPTTQPWADLISESIRPIEPDLRSYVTPQLTFGPMDRHFSVEFTRMK